MNAQQSTLDEIRAAQRGDLVAQQALFERWLPTVMCWTARLGGPRVDAEDAAQDVLFRAFQRLHTLRDPTAFDAWLFGMTRRVLAWHRRRVWLSRWVPDALQDPVDDRGGPEQQATRQQTARLVQRILEKLPTAQREVVVLCYIEERTTAEAAHLLGISQGTVKSRLRLGRERFAHHARGHGLRPDPPALVEVKP